MLRRVRDRLAQLGRRLQNAPWNRPGADKTAIVNAMWQGQRFAREVRRAVRERGR